MSLFFWNATRLLHCIGLVLNRFTHTDLAMHLAGR